MLCAFSRTVSAALATCLAVVVGCNKPRVLAPLPPPHSDRPTTQQIIDAPRKKTPLLILPITVTAPDDWRLDPPSDPSFLVGTTPSGTAEISISMLMPLDQKHVELYVNAEKARRAANPSVYKLLDFRQVNGLQVLETVTYNSLVGGAQSRFLKDSELLPATMPTIGSSVNSTTNSVTPPATDSSAQASGLAPFAQVATQASLAQAPATTLPDSTLSWNFIFFVPHEKRFIPCSFDMLGLTPAQYETDQGFLRSIFETACQTNDTNVP